MQLGAAALCLALTLGGGGSDGGEIPDVTQYEVREVLRQEVQVPVLFFHHIDQSVTAETVVTPQKFEEVAEFLYAQGYETLGFDDLIAYVDEGEALPAKPVIITFDDGYRSNLTYAAPVLRENQQKATVFVIGVSMGKETYRDTDKAIIPHFGWEEAKEWDGMIDLGCHTYDMHQSRENDGDGYRLGVLPKDEEVPGLHYSLFLSDTYRFIGEMTKQYGKPPLAFAYPYGRYNEKTEDVLRAQGIRVSLTVSPGRNPIVRGDPGSLYHLHRFEVFETTTLTEIQNYLDGK